MYKRQSISIDRHSDSGLQIEGGQIHVGAGDGIARSGVSISVDLHDDSGLEFNSGQLRVDLDGNSLLRQDDGLSANPDVVGFNPNVPDFNITPVENAEYALRGTSTGTEWHQISDSEGNDTTDFINESDTPDSYSGQTGNYLIVNDSETALEFFEPFPTNTNSDGEPVLTVLNGMRIRRFEDDGIVFAVFVFQDGTFSFDPSVPIPWDARLDEITFSTQNNADFQEEFIDRLVMAVSDESAAILDESFNSYSLNVSETADAGDLNGARQDIRTGQYNGSAGGTRTVTVVATTNAGNTNTYTGGTYSWGPGGFSGTSVSDADDALPFDQVRTSYAVTSKHTQHLSLIHISEPTRPY